MASTFTKERLDLDKTLEQLGIDDDPRLLPAEKLATLRMTLESRSGVYHPFVGGTPSQLLNMPDRGSHAPGTFWYYNNWDFNVLGTIFEQTLQTKINVAFRERIAGPLQMQDFRLEDMYYQRASANTAAIARSIHSAYHFRLTARDMARFGYLYLRQGKWKDTQVIPADWVKESTTSYSDVGKAGGGGGGGGYGYLWWVNGFGLPVKSFNAWGALGKYIIVIPERDMVVAYQNHTELPDDALAMSDEDVNKLPTISAPQINTLLKMLVDAQR